MPETKPHEIATELIDALTWCKATPVYSAFKMNTVVDWVELRIKLKNPSNFDTVRKRLGIPHAAPLDKGPGGAATEFTLKIQDPTSWRSVRAQLERLTDDHPLAEPPEVIGIEVALDAYSKANDMAELQDMAKRFYRMSAYMVSGARRAAAGFKGSGNPLATESDIARALQKGFNIYVGDRAAAEVLHIYVKTTDNGTKPLPVGQYRARMEITLRGEKLPFRSLEDWESHGMTGLSKYFKFRRLKQSLNPFVQEGLKGKAQIGEKKPRAHPDRHERFFPTSTVSDKALTDRAYDSLRRLTKKLGN